jgi:hypothetical protein
MGEWVDRYGRLPTSYDWSRTHARRRGGEAVRRLEAGEWPPASVVTSAFGSWAAAREAAWAGAVTTPELGKRGVHRNGAVGREPEPDVDRERGGARCADEAINLGAQGIAGIGVGV